MYPSVIASLFPRPQRNLQKIPSGQGLESFWVGEHVEMWAEWCLEGAWWLRAPPHVPCPMRPFHLAVPELQPFMINSDPLMVSEMESSEDPSSDRETWERPDVAEHKAYPLGRPRSVRGSLSGSDLCSACRALQLYGVHLISVLLLFIRASGCETYTAVGRLKSK